MGVRYELDYFPLVLMHIEPSENDDEALATLMDTASAILTRQRPYTCLIRANTAMHAKQRARFATWEKDNAALLKRYYLGGGFVLRSTLVRGAMTALRWIAPAAQPELITGSALEAASFCLNLLEKAEVPELDRPRRYLSSLRRASMTSRHSTRSSIDERTPRA